MSDLPSVRVRPAAVEDVRAIAEFQTECWREVYRGLVPQDYLDRVGADEREPRWRHRLLSGERQIAVAEREHGLVGVVSWGSSAADGGPPLELKSLYVGAHHRHAGLGTTLIQHAIGNRPTQLWVYEGNVGAQAFYSRHGFADDGGRMICGDTGVLELRFTRP